MALSTVWCFTINNYDDADVVRTWDGVKDAIWQAEVGESGTPHLQGFVRFSKNKRLSALKKVSPTAHWEVCKSVSASVDYCSKDDSRKDGPWTIGSPNGSQGKRKDIDVAVERVANGDSLADIIKDAPGMVRYISHLERYSELSTNQEAKRQRRELKVGADLRQWQQELVAMLDLPPDGRHFLYIFERSGNVGKSWMASYLQATRGAFWTRPGKISDLAHAYQREPIVVMDIVRTNVEGAVANVYGFTESLLDGSIFSPKYGSCVKTFSPPHVVVFSNEPPDMSKMSKDRYVVYEIENDTLVSYTEDEWKPHPLQFK